MNSLSAQFRADLDDIHHALVSVPAALADIPWRTGGWTRNQIVGHLLDSATNNRQRFVRASTQGSYQGPRYSQDAWVDAHGYADQPWVTLLNWWEAEHEILMAIVDRIPEERLETECIMADEPPVTLRFLIEDYITHQRWHLTQLHPPVA